MDEVELRQIWHLAVALGVGLLIGLERGWYQRDEAEGERIAGFRTFALIGLLGGLVGLLTPQAGDWLLPTTLIAIVLLFILTQERKRPTERGITTEISAVLTLALGAAAGFGAPAVAGVGAVAAALLLSYKSELHGLLARLDRRELIAVLKLLAISVVVLPLLPDQGYGPWEALNPRRIWWMVVLVAGLSSIGYFAMRILGGRWGLLATAVAGGLASSTAVTAALARRVKEEPRAADLGAAAALLAGVVLVPRLLLITAVLSPAVTLALLPPLAAAAAAGVGASLLLWHLAPAHKDAQELPLGNPFELGPALKFGLVLAVVMLAAEAIPHWLGQGGLLAVAAVAGLTDVDAITLSVTDKVRGEGLTADLAGWAILIAVGVNSLVKSGLAFGLGNARMGRRLLAGYLAMFAAAAIVLLLMRGTPP